MTASWKDALACALLLLLLWPSTAQARHDPLTPIEIDQLRDAAQDPEQRLKLLITFARARLDAVQKAQADPKAASRGQQTHDRLQDFLDVYDELDDNIDMFDDRRADLRKPLKNILEADTEFQAKLQALKASASSTPEEYRQYDLLLANAIDTLNDSSQDHRQLLTEQEEAAKHKKPSKP
jgi:predicted  nucleic acid-binding Zn-ribbon protein